jgi:hypothetical protein
MLLSSPPAPISNNIIQHQQQQQDAPIMIRKRSRSPINNHHHDQTEQRQHHSFYGSSPIQLHQSPSSSTMGNISPFRQPANIIQQQHNSPAAKKSEIATIEISPPSSMHTPHIQQQQHQIQFERQQSVQLQQKQLHQQQLQFKEHYDRQQKELYEKQQRDQYEKQQREQYERQQKEQYEKQRREQYQKQQRELYEKQQREQYEKQQREEYEIQQKEQLERQQQKELYERQQKEQYERLRKEQYERQQKELYERQQKEQYERQRIEQQQKDQQQQQQQKLQQQKLQFERQQQEQTKLQYERQKQQQPPLQPQQYHHNQPLEQKKLHQQKLQFERPSTPVSTFSSASPANTVVPAPPNSIIAQFPVSTATSSISSSPTITTATTMKPMMVKPSTPNTPPPKPHIIQQQHLPSVQQHQPSVLQNQPSVLQNQPSLHQQLSQAQATPVKAAPAPAPLPPAPPVPPRPQLRLHFRKNSEALESLIFDDLKDPMKADLDVKHLRKLTVATLRILNVYVSLEDLPTVDIEEPLSTDSQQVLPALAMQLITTMVLGTSGDKDVTQTIGSQISNGDLVALQRMIVAGLRSKNINIRTVLTDQSSTNDGGKKNKFSTASTEEKESSQITPADYDMIDLSRVKYEPPHNVTRLFLRLYRFIINMLLSTPDCWPFIQPVPETAVFYHQEIKNPMDLYTIEENVWSGKYTKFARFEKDMLLIWKNARAFHGKTGSIPKHADNLEKLFTKIVMDIKKQIR